MRCDWWSQMREDQWLKHGPRRAWNPIYGEYFRKHGWTLWNKVTADEDEDLHANDTFSVREGWQ